MGLETNINLFEKLKKNEIWYADKTASNTMMVSHSIKILYSERKKFDNGLNGYTIHYTTYNDKQCQLSLDNFLKIYTHKK